MKIPTINCWTSILFAMTCPLSAASVWINEIHYDQVGTDSGEFVEIAGTAGTNLTGWSLVLYNGSGGAAYRTDALSGILADAGSGFGFTVVSFPITTFQNGAPDGLALVNDGTVVQFLSYEGSFTAVGGPADGLTSTDLGVFEVGTTPVGHSLQLQGTGSSYEDFTWASAQANTAGAVNGQGQTLVAAAVPELGGTLPLLGVGGGLVLLLGRFRRQASKRLAMPNKHCGFFEGQHGSMK